MKKLVTLAVTLGFAGAAWASVPLLVNPYADVATWNGSGGVSGSPASATGAPNGTFFSLNSGGAALTLDFTDNTCLEDGTVLHDITVFEFVGVAETYNVAAGIAGSVISAKPGDPDGTGPTSIDLSDTLVNSPWFNRVVISRSAVPPNSPDIDAVQCRDGIDFGTAHITKSINGDSDITETSKDGFDDVQFFQFEIEVSNPLGEDLSTFTFADTVPAEFDIVEVAVDLTGTGTCTVTNDGNFEQKKGGANKPNNPNKGGQKLAPDTVEFVADLDQGAVCTLTVTVATDDDQPGKGQNPAFTPTSCSTTLQLNNGVQVFDDLGFLVLIDDDDLVLTCTQDPPSLLAFITSTIADGDDLGGISGADAECQSLADGQSLPGTFIAWLSDSGNDAKDAFDPTFAHYAYVRTNDGATIADDFADLIDDTIDNVIAGTESGGTFGQPQNPWTGTGGDGELDATGLTCDDWDSDLSDDDGRAGRHLNTGVQWTTQATLPCNTLRPMYCFQTTPF